MIADWDIRIVPDKAIPALRDGGMTDEQLETMMVRNPVAWLTGVSVERSGTRTQGQ